MTKWVSGVVALALVAGCGGSGSGGGGGLDAGNDASAGGTAGSGGTSGGGGTAGTAGSGGTAGSAGTAGSGGTSGSAGTAGSGGSAGDAGGPPPSLAGTEFWAVDVPMSRGIDAAWDEPWSVVVWNPGTGSATVTVEQNDAAPGGTPSPSKLSDTIVPAGQAATITMPTREIGGMTSSTADPPGPPYTMLTSNAFRVSSTAPVYAYQTNGNDGARGGTQLIPTNRLGTKHVVLGWPTAHPTPISIAIAGIPDHSSLSIVGVSAGTTVTVTAGADLLGNAPIAAKKAGEQLTVQLGPYDVLNLGSDAGTGDLSGTVVESSAPVAVFSSGERIEAPLPGMSPAPPSFPGHDPNNTCCTDHFEIQLPPSGSLGTSYAVAKSPLRSSGAFVEPDIVRIVGTAAGTTISTSLPAPFDTLTLGAGEVRDIWATVSFTLTSSAPVSVGQVLEAKNFTTTDTGDPSLFLVSDTAMLRNKFGFVADSSFTENALVAAVPAGSTLTLDGGALPGSCATTALGTLSGTAYQRVQCAVSAGAHTLSSSEPAAAYLYGYSGTASSVIALTGS